MMVTRVSLLLLVTGLFASMWSADTPDGRTVAQKQQARMASSPCSIRHVAAPIRTCQIETVSLQGHPLTQAIPLPVGIEPGTYLVVNQAGKTERLTISAREVGTSGNQVPVDQYTVRTAGARWHFIRLEQSEERAVAQPLPQVHAASLH